MTDTALGQRSFQDVLGRFPTGIVVIPARTPAWPLRMAINSHSRIAAVQPAGDHELVLARAVDGPVGTGTEPLVFHAGRYTGLAG